MSLIRNLVQWMFSHPGHVHHYQFHVERDIEGNVKPFWRCMHLLCGDEIEIAEEV